MYLGHGGVEYIPPLPPPPLSPKQATDLWEATIEASHKTDTPRLLLTTGEYAYYLESTEGMLRFGYRVPSEWTGGQIDIQPESPQSLELRDWVVVSETGILSVSELSEDMPIYFDVLGACVDGAFALEPPSAKPAGTPLPLADEPFGLSLELDLRPAAVVNVTIVGTSMWCTELRTATPTCGAGEVLDILIAFDAPVALNNPEEAHLLLNSGSCYIPRTDGLDHQQCDGGTAYYKYSKDDEYGASILRFEYVVQEGDTTAALDVLNASSLRGDFKRFASPSSVGLVDNTVPLAGAHHSMSRIGPVVKIDTIPPKVMRYLPSTIWNPCGRRNGTGRGALRPPWPSTGGTSPD